MKPHPEANPAPDASSPSRLPLVSVVIPAYNAESTLDACLKSVMASSWTHREVIVVCDACTDRTAEVAQAHGVQVVHNDQRQGAAYARNVGAIVARGEILFFIDADVVLNRGAIELAVAALRQPGVDVVFGSYIAETRAAGFFSRFKNYQHHYTHQRGQQIQTSFWSGCGALKRSVFEDLAGFDVSLQACEDIEFGFALTRQGHAVHLLKNMQGEHLKRYSLMRLIRSDLVHRAIPWTRLIRAGRAEMGRLNTRKDGVWSVALTGCLYLSALAAPWAPTASLAVAPALAAWLWLNRELLSFVRRRAGTPFAVASAGALLVHYTICAVGYLAGHLTRPYPAKRTPAPQYAWSRQAAPRMAGASPGGPQGKTVLAK